VGWVTSETISEANPVKNSITLIPLTVLLSLSVPGVQAQELIRLPSSYRQSIEESSRRGAFEAAQPESDHAPEASVNPGANRQPANFGSLASQPTHLQPSSEWTSGPASRRPSASVPQSDKFRDVVTQRFCENIEPKQAICADAPVACLLGMQWQHEGQSSRDNDVFAWNDSSTHLNLPQLSVPPTATPMEPSDDTDQLHFVGLPPEAGPVNSPLNDVAANSGQFTVKHPVTRERRREAATQSQVVQTVHESPNSGFSGLLQVLNTEPSGETEKIRESATRGLRLPISTWETKDGVVYELDVPGVSEKAFDVYIEDRILTLSGIRKVSKRPGAMQLGGQRYGEFRRTFTLPDSLDASTVSAHLDNGVLTIRIDRRTEALPRKIMVGVKGKSE